MNRLQKIQERLRDDPNDVFLNYSHAMELAKAGELQQAQEAFRKVRSLDANYVAAYFQEGQLLAQHGATEEAGKILKAGIETARKIGDDHALGEMTDFLESIS